MDVTGSRPLFGEGPEIAAAIKAAIREEVGLTASVGVATTKLVAKIASTYASPTGSSSCRPARRRHSRAADLAPVGRRRQDRDGPRGVRRQDHRRPGRVVARPLVRRFGKHGASLVTRAVGLDDDPVHEGDPAKSVGHETTFDVDSSDPEVIERTLLALSDGVAGRLRSAGVKASTIAVKIRDSSFRTIIQRDLAEPTDRPSRSSGRPWNWLAHRSAASGSDSWGHLPRTSVSASNSGSSPTTIHDGARRSRRRMRSVAGLARRLSPADDWSAPGCPRPSSAIRGTRWTGGRAVCRRSRWTPIRMPSRVVTAQVIDVDDIPPDDA